MEKYIMAENGFFVQSRLYFKEKKKWKNQGINLACDSLDNKTLNLNCKIMHIAMEQQKMKWGYETGITSHFLSFRGSLSFLSSLLSTLPLSIPPSLLEKRVICAGFFIRSPRNTSRELAKYFDLASRFAPQLHQWDKPLVMPPGPSPAIRC